MKTGLFSLACISLFELAAAQPHRKSLHFRSFTIINKRVARHHHHPKRAQVVVSDVVIDMVDVTFDLEDVIVYVNAAGKPVSTTTVYKNQVKPTSVPATLSKAPTVTVSSTQTQQAPSPSPKQEPTRPASAPSPYSAAPAPPPLASSSAPTPAPSTPPSSSPTLPPPVQSSSPAAQSSAPPARSSSPPSRGGGSNSGGPSSVGQDFSSGVAYSPYNKDKSCKSTSQVASDFQQIIGFQVVRLYGTDCNQVANVIAATHGKVKLFVGIFDISNIQSEVGTISSAVNGDWGVINTVSVGNELVNTGKASVSQVIVAIGSARSALKSAGFSGPVVTVDTMAAMKDNPALCTASDFCAINCHAFFDGNVLPDGAGAFVQKWAKDVSDAAGGKTVVVSESGWPTQGSNNNKAVPSKENHAAAITSLRLTFGSNLVLYSAYNDLWKQDRESTFGAEKYWGIMGDSPC